MTKYYNDYIMGLYMAFTSRDGYDIYDQNHRQGPQPWDSKAIIVIIGSCNIDRSNMNNNMHILIIDMQDNTM